MPTKWLSAHGWNAPQSFHNESTYLDYAHSQMTDFMFAHNLSVKDPDKVRFRHSGIQLAEINVSQIQYGTSVIVDLEPMHDYFSISLPVTGTQSLLQNSHTTYSNKHSGIVICPNQSVRLTMSANCRKRLVRICRSALEYQLGKLLSTPIKEPVVFETSIAAEKGKMASWWRMVEYLEQEEKDPSSIFAEGPILTHVEEMLITGLLYGQPHNYSEALDEITTVVIPTHIRRAQQYIHENARHDITIDQIVAASSVSKRALYESFKRCYGIPPMQYLREVRMAGARNDLLSGKDDEDITTIALCWGFTHLGRFTKEYKKRFNELPSVTRAHARVHASETT